MHVGLITSLCRRNHPSEVLYDTGEKALIGTKVSGPFGPIVAPSGIIPPGGRKKASSLVMLPVYKIPISCGSRNTAAMYRVILISVLLVLFYYLIRRAILKQREAGGWLRDIKGHPSGTQMVQDPVCRVFVPRANAVREDIGGQTYFFCSTGCAKAFQKQLSNQQPE